MVTLTIPSPELSIPAVEYCRQLHLLFAAPVFLASSAFQTGPGEVTSVGKKPGQYNPASVEEFNRKLSSIRSSNAAVLVELIQTMQINNANYLQEIYLNFLANIIPRFAKPTNMSHSSIDKKWVWV